MATFGAIQYLHKPISSILVILIISLVIILGILSQMNQIPHAFLFFRSSNVSQSKWISYTLSQAASKIARNNTLIICTVSEPFLPLLNNWLISVTRQKQQDKVLVIAEDYPTLFKVNKNWPGHAVLLSPPLNSHNPNDFGSEGFYDFTSRRPQHLLQILELGYNVMYNDVDMVWLADPFPYMKDKHDVYVTDDIMGIQPSNESYDFSSNETNICSCMIYLRATNGSKVVMKKWIEEIKNKKWSKGKNINDQPAFNWALRKLARQVDLYMLPQVAFPCGGLFFGNRKWAKRSKGMHVIVHNNYIVGLEKKIERFRKYGLWFVDDHLSESPIGRAGPEILGALCENQGLD